MSLAQLSAGVARDNEHRVLQVLAAAGDIGLLPAELADRTGLAPRTARATTDRLLRRQLATRASQRGRLFATMAGRSEAGGVAPGLDLMPALEEAIDCFPTQAHRAFARLLLSGIVARHHLAAFYPDGWGGFIALGGTQTGKTSLATLAARIFGLRQPGTVRMLPDETPGSVFARRSQGAEGWSVVIPPVLAQPYVCFDEWDKAEIDTRKAAGQLLMGYVATELEGQSVEIRPTVMVCLNTGPEGLAVIPQAYVRRAVVLDTGPLEGQLGDIDVAMRKLFRSRIPRLYLEKLRPPADELSEDDRAALRAGLKTGLTDDGWRLCDVEGLSRLALGRAALAGDQDLRRGALATAYDYLIVATTTRHALPGFAGLSTQLGGGGPLTPDPGAAEAEFDRRQRNQADKQRQARAAEVAFVAERDRRAALLVNARAPLARLADPDARAAAGGLRAALKGVTSARTSESLEEAWGIAATWLQEATRIGGARDQAKAAEAQRRQSVQRSRAAERAAVAAGKRQQAALRRQQRAEWVSWRKRVGGMMPVESAADLMDELRACKVVERIPPPPAPPGTGFLGGLKRAITASATWIHEGREVTVWDGEAIWLATWRQADRQVVALGGKAARAPKYREKRARLA